MPYEPNPGALDVSCKADREKSSDKARDAQDAYTCGEMSIISDRPSPRVLRCNHGIDVTREVLLVDLVTGDGA